MRNQVLDSFAKGIRKSLPQTLVLDEEVMSHFSVKMGASEPAAYAVCALTEYALEPDDDDPIFYGVFDFGGGTTDFDFGLWKNADDDDLRHDYVIEHFGAGTDRYLGGENILCMLAYEVFLSNIEECRKKSITFLRPPECQRFSGDEIYVRDSQESNMNMKQCIEALRPLWEQHENADQLYQTGEISLQLFDINGTPLPAQKLQIDVEKLKVLIRKRIEKGVANFFNSLTLAFRDPATLGSNTILGNPKLKNIRQIHIFLAGNSCRSPIVEELFQEKMEAISQKISKGKSQEFLLYPPLGSNKAKEYQDGLNTASVHTIPPTGKTGVAYGLIECRKGGRIKVIDNNCTDNGESKFLYYIGIARKKTFRTLMTPGSAYQKWCRFLPADEEEAELYYTTLPEAGMNTLPLSKTQMLCIRLPQTYGRDANIYLCAVGPAEIAYAVAIEGKIENNEFLLNPITVKLN